MSIHAKVPAAKGFSTAYLVSPPQLFVVALLVSPEIDVNFSDFSIDLLFGGLHEPQLENK